MIKDKLIPDSEFRDNIIKLLQPYTSTPISAVAARVIVMGDPEADLYYVFISDHASMQSIYMDSDGGVMVETLARVPALA